MFGSVFKLNRDVYLLINEKNSPIYPNYPVLRNPKSVHPPVFFMKPYGQLPYGQPISISKKTAKESLKYMVRVPANACWAFIKAFRYPTAAVVVASASQTPETGWAVPSGKNSFLIVQLPAN